MGNLAKRRDFVAALVAAAAMLALPATATATFAGSNGKIIFQGPQSGTSGPADVFSIDPLGGEALDLTKENGFSEERPAASADGRVVFMSFRDEGWNIFKMNADGSGIVNLTKTEHPIVNFEPTWSPDGSEVVYMRQDSGGQDLWRVGADGSNPENLTETTGVEESGAEFSPDGTKIAYVGTGPKPCCDPEYNNDIWVMNADGSDQTQLTKTNFPRQNLSPTWSPDGTKIAYQPMAGGLWVMNPDGTGATPLVGNTGASYPSWAPAGPAGGGGGGGGSSGPAPSPGPTPPPSNKFSFGKLKLNKAKGTATLTVSVPGPGLLVLGGKGLKRASKAVAAAGKATLPVKATAKALKKLNGSGKVALKAKVTFTPNGGSPRTEPKLLTLKKQLFH